MLLTGEAFRNITSIEQGSGSQRIGMFETRTWSKKIRAISNTSFGDYGRFLSISLFDGQRTLHFCAAYQLGQSLRGRFNYKIAFCIAMECPSGNVKGKMALLIRAVRYG